MQRRRLIQSGLASASGMLLGDAWAQSAYPNKPIKMIIPLAAGSAVDSAARIVSQKMAMNMGMGIAIENQAGASGLIGAERVAKSPPDGYTLGGFNDSIMTMLPSFHSKMPWDILKDFEPVSLVATIEWALVVPTDSPIKTAADLIEAARKAPGKINYGSGGNGSPQHIAMALFALQAGIQLTHVPYKGAAPASTTALPAPNARAPPLWCVFLSLWCVRVKQRHTVFFSSTGTAREGWQPHCFCPPGPINLALRASRKEN